MFRNIAAILLHVSCIPESIAERVGNVRLVVCRAFACMSRRGAPSSQPTGLRL